MLDSVAIIKTICSTDNCELDYEPVGCFKEQEDERVFSRRLVNDVDPRNKDDFTAIYPSFFDNWEKYMKRMVCRCARRVKEENWEYFGITNGGKRRFLLSGA